MAKLARSRRQSYWDTLSDTQLLDVELETDNPDCLDGMVDFLPERYLEAYVEYKYDLRGTDSDEFLCVHGSHKHLAGFVMNIDGVRFKFGWICAERIYGAEFRAYTADYEAAVNRKRTATKRQQIICIATAFLNWVEAALASGVTDAFEQTLSRIVDHLPWIWEQAANAPDCTEVTRAITKSPLAWEPDSPEQKLEKIAKRLRELIDRCAQNIEMSQQQAIKAQIDGLIRGAQNVVDQLSRLVEFFQPQNLVPLAEYATENDNPNKRRYEAGLMSITCVRSGKASVKVGLPASFKLPARVELDRFSSELRVV